MNRRFCIGFLGRIFIGWRFPLLDGNHSYHNYYAAAHGPLSDKPTYTTKRRPTHEIMDRTDRRQSATVGLR